MKKRYMILAAASLGMILTVSVPSALAYFTTYVSAVGEKEVVIRDMTVIKEPEVEGTTKSIVISADEDSEPVFVRVQSFVPEDFSVTYEGQGWSKKDPDDGWIYYADPIDHGEQAGELRATMTGLPSDLEVGDTFNFVVVYEYTPVLYKEADEAWTPEEIADACEFRGEAVNGIRKMACWNKKVQNTGTASSVVTPADGGDTGSDTGEGDGTETGGNNG